MYTAIPAPAVHTRSLPVATGIPHSAIINGSEVRKQNDGSYPYQYVINPCPEKVGWPILLCSACGGESPQYPGLCNGQAIGTPRFCKCTYFSRACLPLRVTDGRLGTDTGPNGVTTSLVTTTIGWATAVATFELETLSEYKALRQSITVTKTFSTAVTTTSSAGSGLETAAVVVLAGGVAWILAGDF